MEPSLPRMLINTGLYYNEKINESVFWVQRGDRPIELDKKSLNVSVASTVGTLGGIGCFIPRLLLPDTISSRNTFINFDKILRLPDENIRTQDCYKLQLFFINKRMNEPIYKERKAQGFSIEKSYDTIYWIRKSDFMVLKYIRSVNYDEKKTLQIVNIYPLLKQAKNLKSRKFFLY